VSTPTAVALVPAREGSKRVVGKNVRPLGGHPMIAYTIAAARSSGVFDTVVVSTDSEDYAAAARHYGAETPFLRPPDLARDTSPDIEWVKHALDTLSSAGRRWDCFSILRPTSPFRKPETILRAWSEFLGAPGADSLRAVERCSQHPGKMWVITGDRMVPLLPLGPPDRPWHSSQYAALPEIWVQNASLEIAWCRVAEQHGTIAGEIVVPFQTTGHEGIDVNSELDFRLAEEVARQVPTALPAIRQAPWSLEVP
jgi:CMP-N,N'-diacetyllegionaminic acid synthase